MKFRLDAQHYINDRLLEPGHIIGDETDVPMVLANGEPMKPSVNMTPLDGEAAQLMRDTFPGVKLADARDPTKAIPLRGSGDSAKAPALVKGPDGLVQQPTGAGPVKTVGDVPGGYVEGKDHELKKGLPDSGSPNHPVGQPVIGTLPSTPTPVVPAKPEDPNLRVAAPQAEKDAVAAAQKKAQDDAAKAAAPKK